MTPLYTYVADGGTEGLSGYMGSVESECGTWAALALVKTETFEYGRARRYGGSNASGLSFPFMKRGSTVDAAVTFQKK